MTTAIRQEIERRIVSRFVSDALAAGHRLAVSLERGFDTEEMLLGSRSKADVMRAVFEGDDAHIFVQPAEGNVVQDGQVVSDGWVYVVLGNDGWDVISDYTTNLETLMQGANKLADKYSN